MGKYVTCLTSSGVRRPRGGLSNNKFRGRAKVFAILTQVLYNELREYVESGNESWTSRLRRIRILHQIPVSMKSDDIRCNGEVFLRTYLNSIHVSYNQFHRPTIRGLERRARVLCGRERIPHVSGRREGTKLLFYCKYRCC